MIPNQLHPCKDIFYFNDNNPYFVFSSKHKKDSKKIDKRVHENFYKDLFSESEEEEVVVVLKEGSILSKYNR